MSKTGFGIALTIFCCLIALGVAACSDDTLPTSVTNTPVYMAQVPISWCQTITLGGKSVERWSERGDTCHDNPKFRGPPICALQDRNGVLYASEIPCVNSDGWGAKTDATQSWKVAADEPRPQTAGPRPDSYSPATGWPATTGVLGIGTANTLIPLKPASFILNFGSDGKSITIRPDGRVELTGLAPDEASALFWERLQQMGMRLACPEKLDPR